MNPYVFISIRYLKTSKKSLASFMILITYISLIFSTAATTVTNSITTALGSMIIQIAKSTDPDIKIKASSNVDLDKNLMEELTKIRGIKNFLLALEGPVLLKNNDHYAFMTLLGVSDYHYYTQNINEFIQYDNYVITKAPLAISVDLVNSLNIKIYSKRPVSIIYPDFYLENKYNIFNTPYKQSALYLNKIFSIDSSHDNKYIITTLNAAQKAMLAKNKINSIYIYIEKNKNFMEIKKKIRTLIKNNNTYKVSTVYDSNKVILQAAKNEKILGYSILLTIMSVSSLNIAFFLLMFTLINRDNFFTLYAIGINKRIIKKIFFIMSFYIATLGSATGCLIGFILCFLQKKFALINLGADIGTGNTYPVCLDIQPFILTFIFVVSIALLLSNSSAKLTTKFIYKNNNKY